MAQLVNPDYTLIPDEAEVWVQFASDMTGSIADAMPDAPDASNEDLEGLGWIFTGYIDDEKGIPLTPSSEVKKYNAFGHRNFRVKIKNGELESSFTPLEVLNPVVKRLSFQGSAPNKIGAPKNVQVYLLYRVVDEDLVGGGQIWVTLRPAPVQPDSHSGFKEGEKTWVELKVYHTTDANKDIFQVIDASTDDVAKTVTIPGGVTAYTFTAGADTTTSITLKTKAALQNALRALASVQALPAPGATVEGPDGGPLVVTFTGPITPTTATGTGGTVVVA